MTKEFIPYQQALDLKELGFDEPCFAYWFVNLKEKVMLTYPQTRFTKWYTGKEILAPLYQQAFRWFREKKIHSIVQEYDINNYMFSIDDGINRDIEVTGYDSYEKAELECLKQLIKIVKDEKSKSNS